MNIKQSKVGDRVIVSVNGRIDTNTAPSFLEYLNGVMSGLKELEIDLADVDYISSAGLRVILFAQKTMNGQGSLLFVSHVNSDIMETFELTGFTDILNII